MSAPLKFTPAMKDVFIDVLEKTCSVTKASDAALISRQQANKHRREDLEFSRRWDEALNIGLDDLLGEAYERATAGKSDRLLEVMLKFSHGDRLADRLRVSVDQTTGLDPDVLLAMPAADRQALMDLLTKYTTAQDRLALQAQTPHPTTYLEHDDGRNQ